MFSQNFLFLAKNKSRTNNMKYLIGIDGGGTGSTCVIADLSGKVLYRCSGGPTNILRYSYSEINNSLLKLITESLKAINAGYSDVSAIVLGTAGAGKKENAENYENAFIEFLNENKFPVNLFKVVSDARIALEGAFSGKPGCILIAGTGSIIFGKNESSEIFRVGGYGNKIGDEGGGYSIGRKGLNIFSKEFDLRAGKSKLGNMLIKKFRINSGENLIDEIYKNNLDIASVAPLVIEAAEKNDPPSVKILDEESDELILHIKQMKELLGIEKMKLSFIGSLISKPNFYTRLLKSKVKIKFPAIEIVEPENPPEVGAVLLATNYL